MRWSSIPLTAPHLCLGNTLPIGQSFFWHHHAGIYSRAVHDPPRVVFLRQTPTDIQYAALHPDPAATDADYNNGTTRKWIEDYFQLSYNLPDLYAEWRRRDPGLFARTELDDRALGVRVLRQDPWECLIGFITSTNNHISRISSLMHKMAQAYSPPLLEHESVTYHLFPRSHLLPSKLEAELRTLGFGYRARFIESSLATLREKFGSEPGAIERGLDGYRALAIETVRDELVQLKGVGRKVADCVMLMSLDQLSTIPIDTHVAAIAARHPAYPSRLRNKPMSKPLYEQVQAFLQDKWGPLGGWCQAVMFSADLSPAKGRVKERGSTAVKDEPELVAVKEEQSVLEAEDDGSVDALVKVETFEHLDARRKTGAEPIVKAELTEESAAVTHGGDTFTVSVEKGEKEKQVALRRPKRRRTHA